MLPGGVGNQAQLRGDDDAVAFVRDFFEQGKPVAAISHAPWTLIEAGVVDGRTVTSWPTLRTDLRNAGAEWVDKEVVVDAGLVTSRKPDDLPAFNARMISRSSPRGLTRAATAGDRGSERVELTRGAADARTDGRLHHLARRLRRPPTGGPAGGASKDPSTSPGWENSRRRSTRS